MRDTDHRFKLQEKQSISTKQAYSSQRIQVPKNIKLSSNFSKIRQKIIESNKQEDSNSPKHFKRNNQFKDKFQKSIKRPEQKNSTSIQQQFGLKFASPNKIESFVSHSRKKQILRQNTQPKQQRMFSLSTNQVQNSLTNTNKNYVQKLPFLQTERKPLKKQQNNYEKNTQRLPKTQTFLQQQQMYINLNRMEGNNRPASRCRSAVSKIAVHNQNNQQVLSFTGIFNRNHQTQDTFYLYWKKKAHQYLDQNIKLSNEIKQLRKEQQNQKMAQYKRQKQILNKKSEENNCIDHQGQLSSKSFQYDLTKKIKYYQQELQRKIDQIISLQEKIVQLNQKIAGQKQRDFLFESLRQQIVQLSRQNNQLKQQLAQKQQNQKSKNDFRQKNNTNNLINKLNQYRKQKNLYQRPPKYPTKKEKIENFQKEEK